MRRFLRGGSMAVCAALAALVFSCDLIGPQDHSFFNPSFYGLVPAEADGLTAAGADGKLTLAWNRAENAEYYEVFYGTTPEVRDLTPLRVTETHAVIKNLANNVEYHVWVRGANSLDTGRLRGPVRATPRAAAGAPDAPKAPRAAAWSGMVVLDWLPVEGALSYDVWKGTSDNSTEAEKCAEGLEALAFTVEGLINETTYYFWIAAKNAAGESGLSGVSQATPSDMTAPPITPTPPVLTAGSGQLTASWQSVPWAERYEIWIATESNSAAAIKYGGDIAGTSTMISGLTNGTRYYVWLRAKNNAGTSDLSPPANAVPTAFDSPPTVPAAPDISLGSGTVTLSWPAVSGSLAYEIWYGTTGDSGTAAKYGGDVTASLGATVTGLANGTPYWFWLKAKNNVGESGFSPAAQAKPIANAAAPSLAVGNGTLAVTWAAAAGADSYDIFYGTGTNPPSSPAQTGVAGPSVTLTALINGTTYSVWVRGKNSTGSGAISPAAQAKPLGGMGAVSLAPGHQRIDASWQAVAGADSYAVYYSTGAVMPANPAQTVSTTQAAITALANGTVYYVWVKPRNTYGAGAVSAAVNAKPLGTPAAPILAPDNGKLTVTWTAVTGADQYDVFYNTGAAMPGSPAQQGIAGTSATLTNLVNGTTYYVWVRGKNSTGAGAASPAATGTPTNKGFYKGATFAGSVKIGNHNLVQALSYLSVSSNTQTGDKYYIVLGANETSGPQTLSYSGKTVDITLMADGAERTVQLTSDGSLFTINSGVTLTLEDNVTFKGRSSNTASLVRIDSSGVFTMNGGKISGNTLSSQYRSGGGVYIYDGTFTMSGGKISGNTSSSSGGGVEVGVSGTFTMNSGEISGNTSSYGGGVYNGVTFTMSGGTISGNTASSSGGGVYNNGTFTMNAGAIINGNTAGGGGGVSNSGTFTMNNGTISGNTASSYAGFSDSVRAYGGGVHINMGTFEMRSGTINGNSATSSVSSWGGGVSVSGSSGEFKKTGNGIIYGNNAIPEALKNSASGNGDALYKVSSSKKRNSTIPAGMTFNSNSETGWE